jgi:hypothetical protein
MSPPCRRAGILIDAVTDRALSPTNSVLLTVLPVIDEPPELRRANGSSVYEVAGSRRYTSVAILYAERRILGEAACQDFRVIESQVVDLARREAVATRGPLGPDQAEPGRRLAASCARCRSRSRRAATVTLRTSPRHGPRNTVIGPAPTAAARCATNSATARGDGHLAKSSCPATGTVPNWVEGDRSGRPAIVEGRHGHAELAARRRRRRAGARAAHRRRPTTRRGRAGGVRAISTAPTGRSRCRGAPLHPRRRTANRAEAAASLAIWRAKSVGLGHHRPRPRPCRRRHDH